jgi:hypothetical protein
VDARLQEWSRAGGDTTVLYLSGARTRHDV